jgi:ornithine carbamoyltransferase
MGEQGLPGRVSTVASLKGLDCLTLQEFIPDDITSILGLAKELKKSLKGGEPVRPLLAGKSLGMIFQKPSTRTRVSFEVGMRQLGGGALNLRPDELQLGRGETIADTARVLSRYVNGIMARVFAHSDVEQLAEFATVPVINGLSDLHHPCQVLADLLTINERHGNMKGLKLAYLGDGNNVCNSLLLGGSMMGMEVVAATPSAYQPDAKVVSIAQENAAKYGGKVTLSSSSEEGAAQADVLYTDVWVSMGQEKEQAERMKIFPAFQINSKIVKLAKPDVMVMHCLPAHRGLEITDDVIDGPNSVVWDQAENRLHAQKALLAVLL